MYCARVWKDFGEERNRKNEKKDKFCRFQNPFVVPILTASVNFQFWLNIYMGNILSHSSSSNGAVATDEKWLRMSAAELFDLEVRGRMMTFSVSFSTSCQFPDVDQRIFETTSIWCHRANIPKASQRWRWHFQWNDSGQGLEQIVLLEKCLATISGWCEPFPSIRKHGGND